MENSVSFFEGLSMYGWIGAALWVGLPMVVFIKQDWFFNYHERKPKMKVFEEYCYTYERQFIFMIIRFAAIVLFVLGVGKLLTLI